MVKMADAHEILGVKKDAGIEEIKKRYSMLLKKHKMMQGNMHYHSEDTSIDDITDAYNLLMGYVTEVSEQDETKRPPNPVLKKMGIDEKKAGNFLHYHKVHIIISIVIILMVVSTVRGCVNRVPSDLNLAFIGEFYYNENDTFKQNIIDRMQEIKEISIDGALISPNIDAQQEYAMQMKAMVLFAADEIDVYFLDKETFERYGKQGAFVNLDDIVQILYVDMLENEDYVLKLEDQDEKHLYGVDVSKSSIFNGTNVVGEEKIAAIGGRAKHYETAVQFIKVLLDNK